MKEKNTNLGKVLFEETVSPYISIKKLLLIFLGFAPCFALTVLFFFQGNKELFFITCLAFIIGLFSLLYQYVSTKNVKITIAEKGILFTRQSEYIKLFPVNPEEKIIISSSRNSFSFIKEKEEYSIKKRGLSVDFLDTIKGVNYIKLKDNQAFKYAR